MNEEIFNEPHNFLYLILILLLKGNNGPIISFMKISWWVKGIFFVCCNFFFWWIWYLDRVEQIIEHDHVYNSIVALKMHNNVTNTYMLGQRKWINNSFTNFDTTTPNLITTIEVRACFWTRLTVKSYLWMSLVCFVLTWKVNIHIRPLVLYQ